VFQTETRVVADAVKVLFKDYTEVSATTDMALVSIIILQPFRLLRLFNMWHIGMDIRPEQMTYINPQYQEPSLQYMENDNRANRGCLPIIKHIIQPSKNSFPICTVG
jgi:hypothetical protein